MISNDVKEIAFGAILVLGVKLLGIACIFLMNLVIVRQLDASEAGIFFLSLAIVTFLANIGRLGLDQSVVRFVSIANSGDDNTPVQFIYRKAMLWVSLSCISLAAFLFFFKGTISENVFGKTFLEPVLTVMIFAIPLIGLYTLQASSLQGLKKIVPAMSTLSLVVPLLTLLVLVVFEASSAVEIAIIYSIACALALCVGLISWYLLTARVSVLGQFSSSKLRQSCFPLWGAVFCNQIVVWSPLLLLGIWSTTENVSFFAIAQRTAQLSSVILIATNVITAPKFAVLSAEKRPEEILRIGRLSVRFALSGAIPGFLLIVIWPEWLLGLFGTEFVDAVGALVILAFGQFVNNATGQVQGILSMSGNEIKIRQISFAGAAVCVSLGFALIPIYGLMGAAIAQAGAVAFQNIFAVVQLKRVFGFNIMYFWR